LEHSVAQVARAQLQEIRDKLGQYSDYQTQNQHYGGEAN
jgi:hypothetical protein